MSEAQNDTILEKYLQKSIVLQLVSTLNEANLEIKQNIHFFKYPDRSCQLVFQRVA